MHQHTGTLPRHQRPRPPVCNRISFDAVRSGTDPSLTHQDAVRPRRFPSVRRTGRESHHISDAGRSPHMLQHGRSCDGFVASRTHPDTMLLTADPDTRSRTSCCSPTRGHRRAVRSRYRRAARSRAADTAAYTVRSPQCLVPSTYQSPLLDRVQSQSVEPETRRRHHWSTRSRD